MGKFKDLTLFIQPFNRLIGQLGFCLNCNTFCLYIFFDLLGSEFVSYTVLAFFNHTFLVIQSLLHDEAAFVSGKGLTMIALVGKSLVGRGSFTFVNLEKLSALGFIGRLKDSINDRSIKYLSLFF